MSGLLVYTLQAKLSFIKCLRWIKQDYPESYILYHFNLFFVMSSLRLTRRWNFTLELIGALQPDLFDKENYTSWARKVCPSIAIEPFTIFFSVTATLLFISFSHKYGEYYILVCAGARKQYKTKWCCRAAKVCTVTQNHIFLYNYVLKTLQSFHFFATYFWVTMSIVKEFFSKLCWHFEIFEIVPGANSLKVL